jgi:hypothetical protein
MNQRTHSARAHSNSAMPLQVRRWRARSAGLVQPDGRFYKTAVEGVARQCRWKRDTGIGARRPICRLRHIIGSRAQGVQYKPRRS